MMERVVVSYEGEIVYGIATHAAPEHTHIGSM